MKLYQCMLQRNRWYTSGARIKPVRIVVHSTGANNPELRRYVNPHEDQTEGMGQILPRRAAYSRFRLLQEIGTNQYGNHWNQAGSQCNYCMHAWIGRLPDGTVAACQTLPYDHFLWGCGSGPKGSYNNDAIQFEVCEDTGDPDYTRKAYKCAVDYCAYLCRKFGFPASAITSHVEGHQAGYASNHGDPLHWWGPMGYSMDQLRADVRAKLRDPLQPTPEELTVQHAVEDLGLNSPGYWLEVLEGSKQASAGNVKALLDKSHAALEELRDQLKA